MPRFFLLLALPSLQMSLVSLAMPIKRVDGINTLLSLLGRQSPIDGLFFNFCQHVSYVIPNASTRYTPSLHHQSCEPTYQLPKPCGTRQQMEFEVWQCEYRCRWIVSQVPLKTHIICPSLHLTKNLHSLLDASDVTVPLPQILPDSGSNQPWFRYLWCIPGTKTYLFLNNGRLEPPPLVRVFGVYVTSFEPDFES